MSVRRRLALLAVVSCAASALGAVGASAAETDVTIESVDPSSGPAGSDVTYTLGGTDAPGAEQCGVSSAYRLELLAPDGTLAATGGSSVVVPEGVAPGPAAIRLVCYVPDVTGRRVIYGLCGRFDVVADGEAAPDPTGSVPCPPTPRVALGQSVIAVERAMSSAFNPNLYFPLPK